MPKPLGHVAAIGEGDQGRPLGAEDGTRTRDLNLGKVALYQLSYFRVPGIVTRRRTLAQRQRPVDPNPPSLRIESGNSSTSTQS